MSGSRIRALEERVRLLEHRLDQYEAAFRILGVARMERAESRARRHLAIANSKHAWNSPPEPDGAA